jgi:hypothetical protein
MRSRRHLWLSVLVLAGCAGAASAQDDGRVYAGAVFGVSALSADARAVTMGQSASASMYRPENGRALNIFVGAHLARFFTLQANYIYNANDLTLFASAVRPGSGAFYEQMRESSQHAFVADALVYFRALGSVVRPYLGTGLAVTRFRSPEATGAIVNGIAPPAGAIASTHIGLRSHVGIDLELGRRWSFRYSFSETIGGNPISPRLMPEGERGLMNFQNLFGFLRHF